MSGNKEARISIPTWRCSDFNAAIPIKKRKYFVQPQLPVATEEAASAVLEKNSQPNEQGGCDTSVGRSGLDSSDADENQKMIGASRKNVGEPIPLFPFVSVGNADKAESIIRGQIRVKVEEPNFPIHSSPLAGFEIPSGSNILGSALRCSLGKLPVVAEHPGVVVTSDKTGMKVEQTVLKTHDIVRETCGKEKLRGEFQTEASSDAGIVSMRLGCKTKNSSPYWENEEPAELNLSLSKGVYAPHNTDSLSTCTKSCNHSVANRSNWDLNTTMDAWEDGLDRTTRVKTTGAFLNGNRTLHDIETSSCRDTTVIAKSVSAKQKESVGFKPPTVTLMQFDHQVNPTCSLSLGLGSDPPSEKYPSLSATTSEAIATCTSFSRPLMIAGNMNSLNLRTVKSEVIEEIVRQETESAQVCPIGISINRVKQEVVGRFNQENSPSSDILKLVDPISIKAEPNSFSQSEIFNRKDGTLNHLHTPLMQSDEIRYLSTSSSAANEKLCEVLKHGGVHMMTSCSSHGDHNVNASGVNVTSLSEEKILDDRKICISKELPCNSREELEEELYSYGFESYSGHDLSRVVKKQVGHRNLYDDEKVQGPAAVFAEGNEVADAECGGSNTKQRDIAAPFHGDFQNYSHVEEKDSQTALLGNTGEDEGRIVQDGEQSTHQIIHASEGMSGVSTVSGGNVENPEIVDNSSPVSYKEEISTIDNDHPAEFSESSQSRIINLAQVSNKSPIKTLDASGSFVPLRMERERLPDFPLEPRKYPLRGSDGDEFCKFSRERYHGKIMRSPRLNFMPDRRRFSDQTESNMHDRDTKNFEFDNHGNTRRGGAFMSNFRRGRRPVNEEVTPFSHSFPRRTPSFSYTHRGPRNKEETSAFPRFRDGEKATRGLQQCNNTEPMFMSPPRPYQGRNGCFARGQTKFPNNPKRGFPGFRSRSPIRSRERSPGPSSSFRNRSQEEFGGQTDFSHRRSPSGYRTERISSPDHTGYTREMVVRRHNSPPYSHRPSNAGRGRGYARGRGFVRGRGYGRAGISFQKPSDRVVHRNQGNLNNLDPRERVNYSDDFFEGPTHSERFGVDVNVERRRFGYRHDDTNSFRPSFNKDGCAPTNVETDPDAVRFGQDPHIEIEEQGTLMEIDGKNKNSAENASGGTKNMDEEETSKHSKIWQRDELGGDGL